MLAKILRERCLCSGLPLENCLDLLFNFPEMREIRAIVGRSLSPYPKKRKLEVDAKPAKLVEIRPIDLRRHRDFRARRQESRPT